MGIGLGVVLLLVGLIFALTWSTCPPAWTTSIATDTLGWILIIVGVLAIVLALVMNAQRSRSKTVVEERGDPPAVARSRNQHLGGPSAPDKSAGRTGRRTLSAMTDAPDADPWSSSSRPGARRSPSSSRSPATSPRTSGTCPPTSRAGA